MRTIPTMKDLMDLCERVDAFRWRDEWKAGRCYRIFGYSYIDRHLWSEPYALECRGHTYDVETGDLVCLPPRKFFNKGENQIADQFIWEGVRAYEKLDGSLISTVCAWNGMQWLKTKSTFTSDQAIASREWICSHSGFEEMRDYITRQHEQGYTLNFEWVAPDNQIVVKYERPRLVLLNMRNRYSGLVRFPTDSPFEVAGWRNPNAIPQEHEEGVVLVNQLGQMLKVKTDWYLKRHKVRDLYGNKKAIVKIIINGEQDDLRPFVHEFPEIEAEFNALEDFVSYHRAAYEGVVEGFHKRNSNLSRKEYAIAGRDHLHGPLFGTAMQLYSGKEPDWPRVLEKLLLPQVDA